MTQTRRTTPYTVPAAIVQAAIGRAILRSEATDGDPSMGTVTLRPHQLDAAGRLRTILQRDHVALLADDVGTGKTFTSLAVARAYPQTLIIAPAALLPMWRDAVARASGVGIRLVSMQRFSREPLGDASRGPSPRASRSPSRSASRETTPIAAPSAGTLVIIDEAHHLRTPTTRRYRAVSTLVSGCDLLLVSATPVHNTPRDLRALLALSLGSQSDQLREELLARLIVRRTRVVNRPRIVRRPKLSTPHDPSILDALLALPAPLPAHDGAVAGALVRLGLLRAWCSSDAALAAALRRRLLRGEALQQALEFGRHPTTAELRSWLVGEHEVQLAFPELLAGHTPESGPLLQILSRHLTAVRALLGHVRSGASHDTRVTAGDAARIERLRTIMVEHDPVPIVAFSQFAETVRAVGRALADIAGVGVMTGQRAWIASGSISRHEALASFAPDAQGRPPPPDHQRIRLLLTTDLLAEGVNLQDAGVVVHLDLPWTAALRRQRVGRCARDGSKHARVVVYEFAPPPAAESVLRLYERLVRKARLSAQLVGPLRGGAERPEISVVPGSASKRPSRRYRGADAATAIRVILTRWQRADTRHGLAGPTASPFADLERVPLCGALPAAVDAGIALLRDGTGDLVLAALTPGRSSAGQEVWRVSTSPARVFELLRHATTETGAPSDVSNPRPASWPAVHRALRRWGRRRAVHAEVGDDDVIRSVAHQRAHAALRQRLGRLSPAQRLPLRDVANRAIDMLNQVRGAAAEEALRRWSAASDEPTSDWLTAWGVYAALLSARNGSVAQSAGHAGTPHDPTPPAARSEGTVRILAILLLVRRTTAPTTDSFDRCHDSRSCSTSMEP